MCLVAFSWKVHPEFPLLISANRDEFFDRPTAPLHTWESGLYAGKDLRGGGTWMGFHPNGKWALLTNYRDFSRPMTGEISRGRLVLDFLEKEISPENYLDEVVSSKVRYEGFNLLLSDGDKLFYYSNYGDLPTEVKPGIHAISNAQLNAPWPKTELAKQQLERLKPDGAKPEELLAILKSSQTYPLESLPTTGVGAEMEIQLSAQLIRIAPNYGTVSATSVLRNKTGFTQLLERSYGWDPGDYRDISFSFQT
ncbi:NRDE family protein [Algoriphagus jejuensis]